MPTLMSKHTFERLADARRQMQAACTNELIQPANVFIPWAGQQLLSTGRGLYYVGIAEGAHDGGQDYIYEDALRLLENWQEFPDYAPFWDFLNRLCLSLFKVGFRQSRGRWGWTNLWKVGANSNEVGSWPAAIRDTQRKLCIAALREELEQLRNSLIVITSGNSYGILYETVAPEQRWNREDRSSAIYWFKDETSGNLFIQSYHPNYMRQHPPMFDAALSDVAALAAEHGLKLQASA